MTSLKESFWGSAQQNNEWYREAGPGFGSALEQLAAWLRDLLTAMDLDVRDPEVLLGFLIGVLSMGEQLQMRLDGDDAVFVQRLQHNYAAALWELKQGRAG